MKHFINKITSRRRGAYLPLILMFATAFITLSVVTVQLSSWQRRANRIGQDKITSLGVSEAGVSYYLWHLAHNNKDYSDGNPQPVGNGPYGPYAHEYKDLNGNVIGQYSLSITPPTNGSTVVTVESTGTLVGSTKTRTVRALLGIPSFSQYAVVTNSEVWFGANESTNGPIHSNVGIHYDGTNNGTVSSAKATYTPSASFGGDGAVHNGVWGNGGPKSQWLYPVPAINFQNITADLKTIEDASIAGGKHLNKSTGVGYYIKLKSDGTYDLATVNTAQFSGVTTSAFVNNPSPANGIIFAADNIWIEGTLKGRLTVAAATLPAITATNRNVTIVSNINYTVKDGSDALGLIAQKDVIVGPQSADNLEIDAAMLAQTGRIYRPFCWNDSCNGSNRLNIRNNITIYGSIGCSKYWNWTWVNGSGTVLSGYRTTNQTYDDKLQFAPPPLFPTTGSFAMLSWRELISP